MCGSTSASILGNCATIGQAPYGLTEFLFAGTDEGKPVTEVLAASLYGHDFSLYVTSQ